MFDIFTDGNSHPYKRLFIRFLDISFIGGFYLIGGTLMAKIIDELLGEFDEEKYKKKYLIALILEILLYTSIIMITAYILRHIIKLPELRLFKGFYGYNYNKVSEINGGVILAFSVITFHKEFKNKLQYLVNKRLIN